MTIIKILDNIYKLQINNNILIFDINIQHVFLIFIKEDPILFRFSKLINNIIFKQIHQV